MEQGGGLRAKLRFEPAEKVNLPIPDGAAAKRFFKHLIKSHGGELRKIVTDNQLLFQE